MLSTTVDEAPFLGATDEPAVLPTDVVLFLATGAGAALAGALLFLGATYVFDCLTGDLEEDLPAGLDFAIEAGAFAGAAFAGTLATGFTGALEEDLVVALVGAFTLF